MSKRKREAEVVGTIGHKRPRTAIKKHKASKAVNKGPVTVIPGHGRLEGSTQTKAEKAARKTAKRELWKKKRAEIAAAGDQGGTVKRYRHHIYGIESWSVSESAGGCMLDLDPVLSRDEQYILIAYVSFISVYSTATSVLVRKLHTRYAAKVAAFVLSPIDVANFLYICTKNGVIEQWNWTEGILVGRWNISSQISLCAAVPSMSVEEDSSLFYTADNDKSKEWRITAHRLKGGENAKNTEVKTLLKHTLSLTSLQLLDFGKVIVVTSGSKLIVGECSQPQPKSLDDLKYLWREVDSPEWITSVNARERSGKVGSSRAVVDIAIGGAKGSIYAYENLLGKLKRQEKRTKGGVSERIEPRILHWHRNEVLTVKWSLDGNYLISGGMETVLVIWQLETGHKQLLPHLSAPIQSLIVSPLGSSYAIRMADNSAMVLSTAELKPTVSIAGIQYLAPKVKSEIPRITTVDSSSADTRSPVLRIPPASVSNSFPGRLFLAVPSSSPSVSSLSITESAAYLQTLDVQSAQQLSRQALTRTKVTDRNMGPEGNLIEEPNVTHVQVSHNGKWLATVDEWSPPRRDLKYLAGDENVVVQEHTSRIEVYLKFWLWNQDINIWELVSRIDFPHLPESGAKDGIGSVHDLVSDPSVLSFSTIGDDCHVRIWRPRPRRRNGITIRGKDGKPLLSWTCRSAIALRRGQRSQFSAKDLKARLAFSADGSMLAASSPLSPSSIYLIDTENGEIRSFLHGIYQGSLLGLGILGRYMITLSNTVQIWDLVHDDYHYGFSLSWEEGEEQIGSKLLAVDTVNNTFAVSIHTTVGRDGRHVKNPVSQISIFNPERPTPIFSVTLNSSTTLLLPSTGRKGYYVLNEYSELQTLSPAEVLPLVAPIEQPAIEKRLGGLESVYSSSSAKHATAPLTQQDEVVVVRHDTLSALLDTGASIPARDLFANVASLFSKKSLRTKA